MSIETIVIFAVITGDLHKTVLHQAILQMAAVPDSETYHADQLYHCLSLARKSTPKSTNYRVGACLFSSRTGTMLSDGYTLELPGNTHAEQCCLRKLAEQHHVTEQEVGDLDVMAEEEGVVLYTTMEPCSERLSSQMPCVDRILTTQRPGARSGIQKVYVGVAEPSTFVKENSGRARLEAAGVDFVHVKFKANGKTLEEEILEVATVGHQKTG